jgi:CHAD domain-containing protein
MAKPTLPKGLGPRSLLRNAGRRLLSARLADVRKYEETLLRGVPAGPVHDMRVAARRLRAALGLFGLRDLEPPVKELQDALGAVRDLQLQISWFARRSRALAARRREVLPSATAALRRALDVWRSRTAEQIAVAISQLDEPGRLGGPRIRRAIRRRIDTVEKRLRAALRDPDPPTAHRLRIAAKKLRYFTELAGPALPEGSEELLDELVPLQELLGELHDLDVRISLLEEMGARALRRREQARRAGLARRLAAELRRWKVKKLARKLREPWE